MEFIDYIFTGLCGFFCLFHFIYSFISSFLMKKKIDKFCSDCGSPVYEDEVHKCLSDTQIGKLVDFVNSLRGDDNG